MVYYDTAESPAYLFEQPQQYTIMYQDRQAVIPFSGDRSLFDCNVFDDHFYIFCYDAMDESTGDFSEIVVYKYTMDLQPAGEFCMDLSALNVSCTQLATNSMAIKNDNLFFAIQDDLHFYTVVGDLASGGNAKTTRPLSTGLSYGQQKQHLFHRHKGQSVRP